MFHIEVRQFPHVARAFNLSAEELHARVVSPWVTGQAVELEDRRWAPDRARLVIYEARELAPEELGMGRGWGTVSREGQDVTESVVAAAHLQDEAPAELTRVKESLLAALGTGTLALSQVVEMVGESTWRVSERLELAEQAVWELLHEERLMLLGPDGPLPREKWRPTLLSWDSWSADGAGTVLAAARA